MVSVLVLVSAFTSRAQQNLIPAIGNDDLRLQIGGYTQVFSLPDSTTCPRPNKVGIPDDGSDFQWGLCRVRFDLKSSTPWGFFAEIEAVDLDANEKNWLREAKVSYKVSDDWTLYAGRLFLTSGWVTPSPANIETVSYPRIPFNCYAYGLQLKGDLGDGWSLVMDVTGKSGVAFDSDANWDGLESSTRLQKVVNKNLTLAGTVQAGADSGGVMFDAQYHLEKFYLKGATYTRRAWGNEAKDISGFYAYAGYEVLKCLELHTQFDRQTDRDNIWTTGVRLWMPNKMFELTVDYERVIEQSDDNRIIARGEFRF